MHRLIDLRFILTPFATCKICPYKEVTDTFSSDGFDRMEEWTCAARKQKIAGAVEWHDEIPVPGWCPLKNENEETLLTTEILLEMGFKRRVDAVNVYYTKSLNSKFKFYTNDISSRTNKIYLIMHGEGIYNDHAMKHICTKERVEKLFDSLYPSWNKKSKK